MAFRLVQFNSATDMLNRWNHSVAGQPVQINVDGQWVNGDYTSAGTGNGVDTPYISFPSGFSGFVKIPLDATDKALSTITSINVMLGGGDSGDTSSIASIFSGKSVSFDDFMIYGNSVSGAGTIGWDAYFSDATPDKMIVVSDLEESNSATLFSKVSNYGFATTYTTDITEFASGSNGVKLSFGATGVDNISNYKINLPSPIDISSADYFVFYFKNNTGKRMA